MSAKRRARGTKRESTTYGRGGGGYMRGHGELNQADSAGCSLPHQFYRANPRTHNQPALMKTAGNIFWILLAVSFALAFWPAAVFVLLVWVLGGLRDFENP